MAGALPPPPPAPPAVRAVWERVARGLPPGMILMDEQGDVYRVERVPEDEVFERLSDVNVGPRLLASEGWIILRVQP